MAERELKHYRTHNSKTYLLDDGRRRLEIGGRHIHHMSSNTGFWEEADLTFYQNGNIYTSGAEFPYPVSFDLSTRTATIEFSPTDIITLTPTLGVRNPTVTSDGTTITLAGLWRSVTAKATLLPSGIKFTYTKTASNAPDQIAWILGGNYQGFLGEVGYFHPETGAWVSVPSTLVGNTLTIDISSVAVGQEIDPALMLRTTTQVDDTQLNSSSPDTNYGTSTSMAIALGSGVALIKFDLSSIGSSVTVNEAALTMYNGTNSVTSNLSVYRVLRNWGETTATWNKYDGTNSWTNAGAASLGNDIASSSTDSTGNIAWSASKNPSWNVTSDVQAFVAGTYSNYGWRVSSSNSTGNTLYASEVTSSYQVPFLSVTYTDSVPIVASVPSYGYSASATTQAAYAPENVEADDVIVCFLMRNGTSTVTGPSGYTAIENYRTAQSYHIYYKKSTDGSESGTSISASWTTATQAYMIIFTVRGADTTSPLYASSNTAYETNNTTVRAAGLTATNNSLLLWLGATFRTSSNNITAPSGFTSFYGLGSTTPDFWPNLSWLEVDSGATGDKDGTCSANSTTKHAFMLNFKPASVTINATIGTSASSVTVGSSESVLSVPATISTSPGPAVVGGMESTFSVGVNATIGTSASSTTTGSGTSTMSGSATIPSSPAASGVGGWSSALSGSATISTTKWATFVWGTESSIFSGVTIGTSAGQVQALTRESTIAGSGLVGTSASGVDALPRESTVTASQVIDTSASSITVGFCDSTISTQSQSSFNITDYAVGYGSFKYRVRANEDPLFSGWVESNTIVRPEVQTTASGTSTGSCESTLSASQTIGTSPAEITSGSGQSTINISTIVGTVASGVTAGSCESSITSSSGISFSTSASGVTAGGCESTISTVNVIGTVASQPVGVGFRQSTIAISSTIGSSASSVTVTGTQSTFSVGVNATISTQPSAPVIAWYRESTISWTGTIPTSPSQVISGSGTSAFEIEYGTTISSSAGAVTTGGCQSYILYDWNADVLDKYKSFWYNDMTEDTVFTRTRNTSRWDREVNDSSSWSKQTTDQVTWETRR